MPHSNKTIEDVQSVDSSICLICPMTDVCSFIAQDCIDVCQFILSIKDLLESLSLMFDFDAKILLSEDCHHDSDDGAVIMDMLHTSS